VSRERLVLGLSVVILLAACAVGFAAASLGTWDLKILLIAGPLVIAADMLDIPIGKVRVSSSRLGMLLAAALLGPTQAAVLGVASILVDTARTRSRTAWAVSSNLAAFAACPLAGGLAMHWVADALGASIADGAFVIPIVAFSVLATITNFTIFAMSQKLVRGHGFFHLVRTLFVPLLPSELAMILLSSLIVFAYAHTGIFVLGMLIALFFLYFWLMRELLLSQMRAKELDERSRQLASLQVGVLTAMLKTLSLRDHMTARHSAAVARYARALAREAGCSEQEQELVHTAGLLHDIGKFIFPDRILLADSRLSDEDWEIVKCHPYQGAKIVRHVEGYGPVADIILGHHERVDGKGYPRGLHRDQIPLLSRMISIADTYDVMTARDSYRKPVSRAEAIAELRRVAGAQLDDELVALFVAMVERGDLIFRHGDDADFDAELDFERRVTEHAAPRALAA
jgi:putative nucleotidyltransferase with HDIG domain